MPKLIPPPPVEVYARAIGKFNWSCPNCSQEHPFVHFPWRRAEVRCRRCHAHFQMGIGFFDGIPSSTAYLMGKWNTYIANRFNPLGTPASALLRGSVEWACPSCTTPQQNSIAFDNSLTCEHCSTQYWLALLFYRLPNNTHYVLRAPHDSIVKDLHAKTAPVQPAAATPPRPGAGENR